MIGDSVWSAGANPGGMTALEVAAGVVGDGGISRGTLPPSRSSPLVALEQAIRPLLAKPPCVVAFSGGRDSSALLAVAVRLARREGLSEPVALTARWPGALATDEDTWQELVVRELGVRDWEIIEPRDDLDLLGSVATTALRRHGLLWPAPAYALVPMMRRAAGGTLVSGEGGDQLFGAWEPARALASLRRWHRPSRQDLVPVAEALLPRSLRWRVVARHERPYQDWLWPEVARLYAQQWAKEWANVPLRWWANLALLLVERDLVLVLDTFGRLSQGEGAEFAAPLVAPEFVAAVARAGGSLGLGERSAAMASVFSDVLPSAILGRSTKAHFGGIFWGPKSRSFAETWTGVGLDARLVDPDRMRSAWLAQHPVYGAALPLHAAWLAEHCHGGPDAQTPGGIDPHRNVQESGPEPLRWNTIIHRKGCPMPDNYEAPKITVLGEVSDLTQAKRKPGHLFDFPHAAQGKRRPVS